MKTHARPFRAEIQLAQRRLDGAVTPGASSSSPKFGSKQGGKNSVREIVGALLADSHYTLLEELKSSLESRFNEIEDRMGKLTTKGSSFGGKDGGTSDDLLYAVRQVTDLVEVQGDGPHIEQIREDLSLVVSATEKATYVILEAAEHISRIARLLKSQTEDQGIRRLSEEILGQAVHVFEGCGFQDLTGQRIGRVIMLLGDIERRVYELSENSTGQPFNADRVAVAKDTEKGNVPEAVGPALAHDMENRATQEEVDRLFD